MAKKRVAPKAETISEDDIRAALAWPAYEKPERINHEEIRRLTERLGYGNSEAIRLWTYNAYSRRVTLGCVSRVHHSSEGAVTTSQGQGGPWFPTEREAYQALRWAVTRSFASDLLALDKCIPPSASVPLSSEGEK
jgi:hypothetical protein